MSTSTSLVVLRRIMAAFIRQDATHISITRKITEDHAGGKRAAGTKTLPTQTVRIVRQTDVPMSMLRVTPSDAPIVRDEWMLVGPHSTDVQVGDTFIAKSQKFEVVTVFPESDTEKLAGCKRLGSA